jgi:low temperature requirement protein LtrA
MLNGFSHAHSGLRWIVLAGLIIAIINSFSGKSAGRDFTEKDRKLGLIAFIASHVQLVLGLVLYFISNKVDLAHLFANKVTRFYGLEHAVGMLIAIILITMGYMKAKRGTDAQKRFSSMATMYLVALILILVSIPWPFRGLGGSWF